MSTTTDRTKIAGLLPLMLAAWIVVALMSVPAVADDTFTAGETGQHAQAGASEFLATGYVEGQIVMGLTPRSTLIDSLSR